jgi:predicted amidohydrolase
MVAGRAFGAENPVADVKGKSRLKLAAVSVTPARWDKEANFATLQRYARDAAAKGAQLVITPEGFLEGYVANENAIKDLTQEKYARVVEPLDGAMVDRVRELAHELQIHLVLGFAERRDGRNFNSAILISPDGRIAMHYSKAHTADDEPFNTHGAEFPVAETPFGNVGALICYDRQLPETSRILAIKGARLIVVPAWGSYGEMNTVMMRTRAYENSVYLAFVHPNRVMVIDPRGTIVAENHGEGDQLVFAEIDLADERIGRGTIRHRRPEVYGEILK